MATKSAEPKDKERSAHGRSDRQGVLIQDRVRQLDVLVHRLSYEVGILSLWLGCFRDDVPHQLFHAGVNMLLAGARHGRIFVRGGRSIY